MPVVHVWQEIIRRRRAVQEFLRWRRELPRVANRAAAGAKRARADEVTVRVRCGQCGRVLEVLYGTADGTDVRAMGGPGVEAFAGPGRPTHGGLLNRQDVEGLLQAGELRRYRCPRRRCTGDYPVRWEKLVAAFSRAAARSPRRDRVIMLPEDIRGGRPA